VTLLDETIRRPTPWSLGAGAMREGGQRKQVTTCRCLKDRRRPQQYMSRSGRRGCGSHQFGRKRTLHLLLERAPVRGRGRPACAGQKAGPLVDLSPRKRLVALHPAEACCCLGLSRSRSGAAETRSADSHSPASTPGSLGKCCLASAAPKRVRARIAGCYRFRGVQQG
jgi:hypothetical protein